MKKATVIGSGISGLSIARMLAENYEVAIRNAQILMDKAIEAAMDLKKDLA